MMIVFHINVLCFCDGSAFMWGFVILCQGRCPFTPRGLCAFPTFESKSHGPAGRLMTTCYARGAGHKCTPSDKGTFIIEGEITDNVIVLSEAMASPFPEERDLGIG